jgi:hypothetical protein
LAIGEGLAKEAIRATFQSFDRSSFVRQRRDYQNKDVTFDRDELFYALDTVHFRHRNVHGHYVARFFFEGFDGKSSVGRGGDYL